VTGKNCVFEEKTGRRQEKKLFLKKKL